MTARVAIRFATREGQAEKIANVLAEALRTRGVGTDVRNVREVGSDPALGTFATAILIASLHAGGYEREMVTFVRRHRHALGITNATFVSVSLSEAGAEDPERTPEARAQFAADVVATVRAFETTTGWHPARVVPVAGALAYTKYNPLVRVVMKRIAKKVGASTDTSRDHEFTDWRAIDRLAGAIATEMRERSGEIAGCRGLRPTETP